MCGLCGIFGIADHWSDELGSDDLDKENAPASKLAERQRRARIANIVLGHYGLTLTPWMDRFTLKSRTGRSDVVDHLGAVWPIAEKLAGRACDPLDPTLLEKLEGPTAPRE